ncbi:MAG: energy transducer TonB [Pontixanthobacter sp.]
MAYADQQMSGSKIAAIVLVALIHIGIGYLLISGLAYSAFQEVVETTSTFDIDEPEPEEPEPEEEPPPPEEVPETVVPPPFVPPPQVNVPTQRPPQRSTPTIVDTPAVSRTPATKQCSDGSTVAVTARCGPPTKTCPDGTTIRITATCPRPEPKPEPEPRFTPKAPEPRGSPGRWVSQRDYPSRALREEREGITGVRLSVGADGRVTNCAVSRSSGHSDLDEATCNVLRRRARFDPATNAQGNDVPGTYNNFAFQWQIE